MARIVHIVPARDEANGVWRLANLLSSEDGGTVQLGCGGIGAADEVWVHGMWLPCEWIACWCTLRKGGRLVRMTHGSLSPIYLRYHGWKKWLVGPIERFFLRRADRIEATCEAEKRWIKEYLGKRCPPIEVTDIKRFFDLSGAKAPVEGCGLRVERRALHLLYLGRRHLLKGLEFLEEAVKEVEGGELRIVSNAFGDEKEKVWAWCDVLVLPTLSENFGSVVAEALERGKRVITTDGAPAWGGESLEFRVSGFGLGGEEDYGLRGDERNVGEIWSGYGGRLVYLKGFRDGANEIRVSLLKNAIEGLVRLQH